jgi:hypothetical protein
MILICWEICGNQIPEREVRKVERDRDDEQEIWKRSKDLKAWIAAGNFSAFSTSKSGKKTEVGAVFRIRIACCNFCA